MIVQPSRIYPFLLIIPALGVYRMAPGIQLRFSLIYLAVISAVTYGFYWHDKRRAQKGGKRTPENFLHLLEFIGGWPAAFIAQQKLRHKNAKRKYQAVFWAIIILHQILALEIGFRGILTRILTRTL